MSKQTFTDYYRLLQVHYDASPEVIKAAYLKLLKVYHPDSSGAFSDGIERLNQAYDVLKDPESRRKYHKEWLSNCLGNSPEGLASKGIVASVRTIDAAKETLDLFFRYLCIKEWDGAYQLLTLYDRSRTSFEDFFEWREAVSGLSTISAYSILFARSAHDCEFDGIKYSQAAEFNVTVTDASRRTGETGTSTVKKLCVYDGISWKVILGISNIKELTLRFRLEAESGRGYDSMALYHSAVNRIDPLTGLLSHLGFLAVLEEETERSMRYRNPVTLAAFRIRALDKKRDTYCLCQAAAIINEHKRKTDRIARLENDIIICLLTETRRNSGELAVKKFVSLIEKKRTEEMTVNYGLTAFTGNESPEEAINRAAALADMSV